MLRRKPRGILGQKGFRGLNLESKVRVTKDFNDSFNEVMKYMNLDSEDIEECKAEVRSNLDWALEYYPRAAAQIREMQR